MSQPPGGNPPPQPGAGDQGWGAQVGWGDQQPSSPHQPSPTQQGWAPQGVPPGAYPPQGGPPEGFGHQGGYRPGAYGPPPQPPQRRRGRGWLIAGLVVVVIVSGVIVLQTTGVISTSRDVDRLSAGDCVQVPEEMAEITSLDTVPCDQAHGGEVFFVTELPGDDDAAFPVLGVEDEAVDLCLPEFEAYTGLDFFVEAAAGHLDVVWLSPTFGSWQQGDRGLTCIATSADGADLTGSLAR